MSKLEIVNLNGEKVKMPTFDVSQLGSKETKAAKAKSEETTGEE